MSLEVLLCTLPKEGEVIQWQTPKYFLPDTSKYIPLGLLSLQTNANNNNVEILDARNHNLSIRQTVDIINHVQPEVLGLSAITFSAYQLKEILNKTKF